jgi:hypothetical protein
MCDILDQFDLNKFKQKISLSTEKCLSYASKDDVTLYLLLVFRTNILLAGPISSIVENWVSTRLLKF